MQNLLSTETVPLQTTESDLVVLGAVNQQRRVVMRLYNTDSSPQTFDVYEYASGGSATQVTAVHAYKESLAAKTGWTLTTWLLGERKITGLVATTNDKIIAKVSVYELT